MHIIEDPLLGSTYLGQDQPGEFTTAQVVATVVAFVVVGLVLLAPTIIGNRK